MAAAEARLLGRARASAVVNDRISFIFFGVVEWANVLWRDSGIQ